MSTGVLLFLRFVKLLAVLSMSTGTLGAFLPNAWDDRRRFAYFLGAPGLAVAWGVGLAMALGSGVSPMATWIVLAAISSTISLNVVLWAVAKEERGSSRIAAAIAVLGIVFAVAAMVWKVVLR